MDAGTPGEIRAASLSQADIRQIFVGIMLAMFLSGLDQTIVATAMPSMGRDLGDVEHLPWIVTAYLLASTAVTPLYGKFSDMHGRRVTMQIAIGVFVAGSVLCGLAPTMTVLALGRFVQGLGGGGLIAIAQTIVGDMVSPRDRGRYQGYFGTVFASASVLGPLLGGFFAEKLHWSWIFWINLPLGLLAFLLTNERLKRLPRHDRRHRLDVLGAVLMVGATTSLMLALTSGGHRFAWSAPEEIGLFGLSAALWVAFVLRLSGAREPLIPLSVLRDNVVATSAASSALAMGVYVGLSIVVPLFLEARLGLTATQSGQMMIAFMLGVPIGATTAGRVMASVAHYKRLPLVAHGLAVIAVGTMAAGLERLGLPALAGLLFVAAVGLGTIFPIATVATQNAVDLAHLGTATATMNFTRQLAGAVIVTVFGVLALGGGASLEPGTVARAMPTDPASFRLVFVVATAILALAWIVFAAMEERPFRSRGPDPAVPPPERP